MEYKISSIYSSSGSGRTTSIYNILHRPEEQEMDNLTTMKVPYSSIVRPDYLSTNPLENSKMEEIDKYNEQLPSIRLNSPESHPTTIIVPKREQFDYEKERIEALRQRGMIMTNLNFDNIQINSDNPQLLSLEAHRRNKLLMANKKLHKIEIIFKIFLVISSVYCFLDFTLMTVCVIYMGFNSIKMASFLPFLFLELSTSLGNIFILLKESQYIQIYIFRELANWKKYHRIYIIIIALILFSLTLCVSFTGIAKDQEKMKDNIGICVQNDDCFLSLVIYSVILSTMIKLILGVAENILLVWLIKLFSYRDIIRLKQRELPLEYAVRIASPKEVSLAQPYKV